MKPKKKKIFFLIYKKNQRQNRHFEHKIEFFFLNKLVSFSWPAHLITIPKLTTMFLELFLLAVVGGDNRDPDKVPFKEPVPEESREKTPFVCTQRQVKDAERRGVYIKPRMLIKDVLEQFEDIMGRSHKHNDIRFVLDFWFPIFFDDNIKTHLDKDLQDRWDAVAKWIVNLQIEERRYNSTKTTYTL